MDEKMDDNRRGGAMKDWDIGVSRLKAYQGASSDQVIVPSDGDAGGSSNLGAYYPAGTW